MAFYGIDSLTNVNIVCDRGCNYVLAFKDFQAILCYGRRMNNIVRITFFQNKNQRTDALVINPINTLGAHSSSTTAYSDNSVDFPESSSENSESSHDDEYDNETALSIIRKKKIVKTASSSENKMLVCDLNLNMDQIPPPAKHVLDVLKQCKKLFVMRKRFGTLLRRFAIRAVL